MGSPSSRISPPSNGSRRSTQRKSVVLPEPLAPISDTTSAAWTSRLIPLRTFCAPKVLTRSLMVRIGSSTPSRSNALTQPEAPLEPRTAHTNYEIDGEIEAAGESIELHRLERAADDLLRGEEKLADPDCR